MARNQINQAGIARTGAAADGGHLARASGEVKKLEGKLPPGFILFHMLLHVLLSFGPS
jgi:hypothetical protein